MWVRWRRHGGREPAPCKFSTASTCPPCRRGRARQTHSSARAPRRPSRRRNCFHCRHSQQLGWGQRAPTTRAERCWARNRWEVGRSLQRAPPMHLRRRAAQQRTGALAAPQRSSTIVRPAAFAHARSGAPGEATPCAELRSRLRALSDSTFMASRRTWGIFARLGIARSVSAACSCTMSASRPFYECIVSPPDGTPLFPPSLHTNALVAVNTG